MFTLSLNHFLAPSPVAPRETATRHALRRRELLVLAHPRGARVCCHTGRLWLTVDRSPADIVLEPGESFACDADRRVIVQALRDATVGIER